MSLSLADHVARAMMAACACSRLVISALKSASQTLPRPAELENGRERTARGDGTLPFRAVIAHDPTVIPVRARASPLASYHFSDPAIGGRTSPLDAAAAARLLADQGARLLTSVPPS